MFKLIGKRPALTDSVSEEAMKRAIVTLIENHKDEFNGILSLEHIKLLRIKCKRIIRP